MKAAVFHSEDSSALHTLRIEDVPKPQAEPGQVLLRVRACGVCRTDLHILDRELPPRTRKFDSWASDCWRNCGRCDAGIAGRNARGCVVDGRSGWNVLVLSARKRELVR